MEHEFRKPTRQMSHSAYRVMHSEAVRILRIRYGARNR